VDDPVPGFLRSTDGLRQTIVTCSMPMPLGCGVAMPTASGPFRLGNPGRRSGCGFVRVRPQPRQLLAGRRIECRVRR